MEVTTIDQARERGRQPLPALRPVAPPPRPPEDFLLGDWLVQPTLGRLSRGEVIVRVRPQLMDVLVCLASGNGRTVMKQQITDTVWSDRFVTESALARTVAELRHLLGDDARHPRLIETISKRGYRVVAPVRWGAPIAEREAGPPGSPAPELPPPRRAGRALELWTVALATAIAVGLTLLLIGGLT